MSSQGTFGIRSVINQNSSHANVHSQNRPHYCPVKECSRSEGGKGFKRKNEMIRHGLVHRSPGYICPFCPEREHKYPRPDNLQRWALGFSFFKPSWCFVLLNLIYVPDAHRIHLRCFRMSSPINISLGMFESTTPTEI